MTQEEFRRIVNIIKAYDYSGESVETVTKITDGIIFEIEKAADSKLFEVET